MRTSNKKFFMNAKKKVADAKQHIDNPCYGPLTAFCNKVTYLKRPKGGLRCWKCGNYHDGENKK